MSVSVQTWLKDGCPRGVPFVLVRHSRELPADPKKLKVFIKQEVSVLAGTIKSFAEHHCEADNTYTIKSPDLHPFFRLQYCEIQRDDMSFLVYYDPQMNSFVAGAEITII